MDSVVLVGVAYRLAYLSRGSSVNRNISRPVESAYNVVYFKAFAVSPPISEEHLSALVDIVLQLLGNVPCYLAVASLCRSRKIT